MLVGLTVGEGRDFVPDAGQMLVVVGVVATVLVLVTVGDALLLTTPHEWDALDAEGPAPGAQQNERYSLGQRANIDPCDRQPHRCTRLTARPHQARIAATGVEESTPVDEGPGTLEPGNKAADG